MVLNGIRWQTLSLAALMLPTGLSAQIMPTIDTEDAELGTLKVGKGRFHPSFSVDVRNGDFARGNYDDDAANLDRLPVHAQIGFGYELSHGTDGRATAWIVGSSSNGFHAPASYERDHPRAWYESNNLLGIVITPAEGLTTGVAYTIKTSPNEVAGTSHEASATVAYEAKEGVGVLHPSFAMTLRPKGGQGFFTQLGIEPGFDLSSSDSAPTLNFPVKVGVGWKGFYEAGTGTVAYGSAGVGLSRSLSFGSLNMRAHAEALAVWRDRALSQLGSADAETGHVVPLVTVGVSASY
jgi:hypothetical protein